MDLWGRKDDKVGLALKTCRGIFLGGYLTVVMPFEKRNVTCCFELDRRRSSSLQSLKSHK